MRRRQLLLSLSSLAILALVACVLWGWPGYLRGRTDPATAPAATATRLAEGLARGDAATLGVLAPEDGSDRQLLTPEAARATYGEAPRISVEAADQGRASREFNVTIAGDRGTTRFVLSLEQLAGPFGEWTPQPLNLPLLQITDHRASGVDDPILVNGTAVTLPAHGGTSSMLALPLGTSTATAAAQAGAPLTSTVDSSRFALSIRSTATDVETLVLGTGLGEGFATKAKAATLRFLESCAAAGDKQPVTCPLAPPARARGVSERRAVSYSRFVLSDAPPQAYRTQYRTGFSAAVVWEQRVGNGPWTSASGSSSGRLYGSFARLGDGLEFVPDSSGVLENVSARIHAENPPAAAQD